jgi:transcriptional regulator with XRE-family HTH domain
MEIGGRIKQLRKQKGMTLKDLSAKIDMSVSFISDIENEKSLPSLKRCKEIAHGLNVSVSSLLGEKTQENSISSNDGEYNITFTGSDAERLSDLLYDFDEWRNEDRKELISYLTAKKAAKNHKQ